MTIPLVSSTFQLSGMRSAIYYWLLLTGILFIWAGMVGAISFMEAPLKFTAPHITLQLGVGIGRVIFHALNKVEMVLCLLALGSAGVLQVPSPVWRGLLLPTAVLLLETAWLLPALDVRAEVLLQGKPMAASYHHWLYIGLEIVKLISLLLTATLAFRTAYGQGQPRAAKRTATMPLPRLRPEPTTV